MGLWLLTDLLLPAMLFFLAEKQRPLSLAGKAALIPEFFFLASLCHLGGPLCLVILLGYVLIFTLEHRFYERMGWSLDALALRYAFRERHEVFALFGPAFGWKGLARLLVLSGLAVLGSLGPSQLPDRFLIPFLLFNLGLLLLFSRMGKDLPPVPHLISLLLSLFGKRPRQRGLKKGDRMRLPIQPARQGPQSNILLILCESLSRKILHSPEGIRATPRYHAFLQQQAGCIVSFPFAICNSSASDVSYPSLLTGLSPTASSQRFHRNPLIWASAAAMGMHTSLYSSQSMAWGNLESFLIDDTLDRAVYREVLQAPAYCALAMDDRLLNRVAIDELTHLETPFFSVVNFNMLHYPYRNDVPLGASGGIGSLDDYLAALEVFDQCFGDLLDALRSSVKLDHTTILFTSDHGETPAVASPGEETIFPLRVCDFAPEILHIPFWIRLARNAPGLPDETTLRSNTGSTVSNIDIYPTVLHLLGWDVEWRERLCSGRSLFDHLLSDRVATAFNTGELREWKYEPFALAQDGWLLIFHDIHQAFELVRLDDPFGRNWWDRITEDERDRWKKMISRNPDGYPPRVEKHLKTPRNRPASVEQEYNERATLGDQVELHRLNNWSLFNQEDWREMCRNTARFVGIRDGDHVFEAGCGAGAFLEVLGTDHSLRLSGVDLAGDLVKIAQQRLTGDFRQADIQDLSLFPSDSFDKVLSHGVFLYLPDRNAIQQATLELVRITKPGGWVYIGVLNDPARLSSYQSPHAPSGNYCVSRNFWKELALRQGWHLEIVDQDKIYSKPEGAGYDAHSRLRYSVLIRRQ